MSVKAWVKARAREELNPRVVGSIRPRKARAPGSGWLGGCRPESVPLAGKVISILLIHCNYKVKPLQEDSEGGVP